LAISVLPPMSAPKSECWRHSSHLVQATNGQADMSTNMGRFSVTIVELSVWVIAPLPVDINRIS
jgi:hypothetical protein